MPGNLNPLWLVSPFKEESMHNTAPFLMFEPGGNTMQGPPPGIAKWLTATVSTPLPLTVWAADDAKVFGSRQKVAPGTPNHDHGPNSAARVRSLKRSRRSKRPNSKPAGKHGHRKIQHYRHFE